MFLNQKIYSETEGICTRSQQYSEFLKFYEERIIKTEDLSNRPELSEGDLDSEEFQLTEKEYEQISSLECLGDVDDCNPEENDTEKEAGRNFMDDMDGKDDKDDIFSRMSPN